jgi:GNAT superfamily N-acetyltransferase
MSFRTAAAGPALADLQPLAERIFGRGDRAPGWFARKLAREAVDPARSVLALAPGDEPVGYMLVGAADPGRPGVLFGAGLGVAPEWRGRGVGAALAAAAVADPRPGDLALRVLAEPPRRGFYERLGFVARAQRHTLHAAGAGVDLDLRAHPPRAWPLPGREVAAWREGPWARTPAAEAATLELAGGAWTHVSREGRALLVQRLCLADDGDPAELAAAALADLRRRVGVGAPLLVYGCDAVSCVTASLLGRGWSAAQTAYEMERRLA